MKRDLVQRGSQTARDGFKNEHDIAERFNNWQHDTEAQAWLVIMGYAIAQINRIKAVVLHGYKADVNVQIYRIQLIKIHFMPYCIVLSIYFYF